MPRAMIRQVTGHAPIAPVEAAAPLTWKALPSKPMARMMNTRRVVAISSERKFRQGFQMAGIVQKVPSIVSGSSDVAL